MKRYGLAFALIVLTCSTICHAGASTVPSTAPALVDLKLEEAYEYTGDIGGKLPIGMTLRFGQDGKTATGCYFYYKYCKDIRIGAKIDSRSIVIREFDAKGNQTGRFVGEFVRTDPRHHYQTKDDLKREVIVGDWSKPDGSQRRPFYLDCADIALWPEGKSRYAVAGFDDEAGVDRFVARFRQAVLDRDVDTVVGMIRFPIEVLIDDKRKTINGSQDLRRDYDTIFRPDYVEWIRNSAPCHMFSRDQGVMFGCHGQVWVAAVKSGEKTVPAVTAINNEHWDIEANVGD